MSIRAFILGLVAGILANQVFAMVTRALPSQWVRYTVKIGQPEFDDDISSWKVPVKISSPPWYRRMFMLPLNEYLLVEIKLDNGKWVKTKWDKGDTGETMLLANGVMTVDATIFTRQGCWYLADKNRTDYSINSQNNLLSIRIKRSLDNEIADEFSFPFSLTVDGKIEINRHGGENAKT